MRNICCARPSSSEAVVNEKVFVSCKPYVRFVHVPILITPNEGPTNLQRAYLLPCQNCEYVQGHVSGAQTCFGWICM